MSPLAAEDRRLIAALADGLPLVPQPYAALGAALGWTEGEVIERLRGLVATGVMSRFGVIVRHHELGIRANAMVVWDVPGERVRAAGAALRALPYVTLCYRRPRRPPAWPYNLFCMIHGRERAKVETLAEEATVAAGLAGCARSVLFSRRRFKQRGARYVPEAA
jgi:DNA-binding Lrp family transcriptional regulator